MQEVRYIIHRTYRSLGFGHSLKEFDFQGGHILFESKKMLDAEAELGKIFQREVKEGMTIVDVGAHLGYFTLIAARTVGVTGRVYAFEPNPYNFTILKKNIKFNKYSNVRAVKKAVSRREGTATFNLKRTSPDTGSLINAEEGSTHESFKVKVTTLDSFFSQEGKVALPNLIKIDAEGADALVVEGGINTITKCRPVLIIEIFSDALRRAGTDPKMFLRTLTSLGYKLELLDINAEVEYSSDKALEEIADSISGKGFMNVIGKFVN